MNSGGCRYDQSSPLRGNTRSWFNLRTVQLNDNRLRRSSRSPERFSRKRPRSRSPRQCGSKGGSCTNRKSATTETQKREYTKSPFIGRGKLQQWSEKDSGETVLLDLISKKEIFSDLLDKDLDPNWIVLIVSVLSKVFVLPFLEASKEIMNVIAKWSFLEQLQEYVSFMHCQSVRDKRRNYYFWDNEEEFFDNLAVICECMIENVPKKAYEFLPTLLDSVDCNLPKIGAKHSIQFSGYIFERFKSLIVKTLSLDEVEKNNKTDAIENIEKKHAPPNDFRTLSIYPTYEEIFSKNPTFIKKNIVEGAYDDVEHYLDIQFRLLKEDFVAPLRQGIREYFNRNSDDRKSRKFSSVTIHREVMFEGTCFINDQMGLSLKFMGTDASRVFTSNSKRFIYGSLVCFTKDNFATLLFGKILKKDVRNLKLLIAFINDDYNSTAYELKVPYVMVECKIYFEPYYHVLKALQRISSKKFPMKSYLIDTKTAVEPPDYLQPDSIFTVCQSQVELFSQSWPTAKEFGLNSSQHSAFKAALTQKFVVIQGPPGTGKTYLGLEIVKTLLHEDNIEHWYNKTPILVVCFTNRALDQFLEGLISVTHRIVRIGGQSKSEKLKNFQLINKRKGRKDGNSKIKFDFGLECATLLGRIKTYSEQINRLEKFDSIVDFEKLTLCDTKFYSKTFYCAIGKDLLTWLLGGRENESNFTDVDSAVASFKVNAANDEVDDDDLDYEEDEEKNRRDVALDESVTLEVSEDKEYLIKLSDLESSVKSMQEKLEDKDFDVNWPKNLIIKLDLRKSFIESYNLLRFLKDKLKQGQRMESPSMPAYVNNRYPNNMRSEDRWQLYFYWLHTYLKHLKDKLLELQIKHSEVYRTYSKVRDQCDTDLMKDMLVVGMTTTGAARLQTTLQNLKCRIVVVEEAAEVLESHVVASLTNHCQHLILIGDHQQLRPSTADYRLEKKFNLGISMFERMVMNKIQCNVLDVQHRMRSEIASLIAPAIYSELKNHPSVENFPPVLGMDTNLFFIHHTNPEVRSNDVSKSNLQEAKFLINLAKYLVQNGHKPEDITILTAYSGQKFNFYKERRKNLSLLKNVRISVLDDYQGEESKIVLLSLVRNNTVGKIGFLKIENRVCVALSRAKEGLYMMGNMDLLCDNSKIWPKIRETLEKQGNLGNCLTLRCQLHSDHVTLISKPEDFNQVSNGGCNQICGALLKCSHKCVRLCHLLDRDHNTTKCRAPCNKVHCDIGHLCPNICKGDCNVCTILMKKKLHCGHTHEIPCHVKAEEYKCRTPVMATLECGHEIANKPCYKDVRDCHCPFPCNTKVKSCGHSCMLTCHVNNDPDHIYYKCYTKCERILVGCSTNSHKCQNACYETCPPCQIVVKKNLPSCNHYLDMACYQNVNEVVCMRKCKKKIKSCGHDCRMRCYQPCGGCDAMVFKEIPFCGHMVLTMCSEEPSESNCSGACPKRLACGHVCKEECKDPCTTQCKELVDYLAVCGHTIKISCHLAQDPMLKYTSNSFLKLCTRPCTEILNCSHQCSGTCYGCAQGRIHETCRENCKLILLCGHKCATRCDDVCQPCQERCSLKCSHGKCKNRCGSLCTKCRKPCGRRCVHSRCRSNCSEMCTVPPCEEPCPALLKCGHPCVGFCGDPCPPLCRICNKHELAEIVSRKQVDENVRFVLLDECKHVIESASEKNINCRQKEDVTVQMVEYKRCPKCLIPLTSTLRYSDCVKKAIYDVTIIKEMVVGRWYEQVSKQIQLNEKLNLIKLLKKGWVFSNSCELTKFIGDCENLLKHPSFDLIKGKILEAKMTIVLNFGDILESQKLEVYKENIWTENIPATMKFTMEAQEYFEFLLEKLRKSFHRITRQEILDFEREQTRVQRISQFLFIAIRLRFFNHNPIRELIYKPIVFTNSYDVEVRAALDQLDKNVFVATNFELKELQKIVEPVGFELGVWYKCSKCHYFTIDKDGDSMQAVQCIQCDQQVGGGKRSRWSDS